METTESAQAPTPSYHEVCEYALFLAIDEGEDDKAKLALIHWPENTPPPPGDARNHEWAEGYRKLARNIIAEDLKKPKTFEILYECPPHLVLTRRKWKGRYSPPPYPTWEQITSVARELAVDEGDINRNLLRLIGWRAGDHLKMTDKTFAKHLSKALAYRDQARKYLVERMEQDHRWRQRQLHREALRRKQRGYRWTHWPSRNKSQQQSQPKRSWHPPPFRPSAPRATDPPDLFPPAADPATHPRRCIRDPLLEFSGGGHRPVALRKRPPWNPSPNAPQRSLVIE